MLGEDSDEAPASGGPKAWLELRELSFQPSSHAASREVLPFECLAHGVLRVVNTLEEFKAVDKAAFLRAQAARMLRDVESLAALEAPMQLLTRFVMLAHADLKAHRYLYWLGFACVPFSGPVVGARAADGLAGATTYTARSIARFFREKPGEGFFLLVPVAALAAVESSPAASSWTDAGEPSSSSLPPPPPPSSGDMECVPLATWLALPREARASAVWGCVDPSSSKAHPGWPARNLLALAARCAAAAGAPTEVHVACVRDRVTAMDDACRTSTLWTVTVPRTRPKPPLRPRTRAARGSRTRRGEWGRECWTWAPRWTRSGWRRRPPT